MRSFNEARANCAGNSAHMAARVTDRAASMRPAQIAREINRLSGRRGNSHAASMRPAQIAREIRRCAWTPIRPAQGFNEARANCAGNSGATRKCTAPDACFNEARANCAGN